MWQAYRRSPVRFLEDCGQVYDATAREWLKFELWAAQKDVLLVLEQRLLTVVLKARQLGLSWLVVGWALWLMLFRPAATILFFSKRDQEAVHLVDFRLQGMFARLPEWLRVGVVVDNAHEFRLVNGSQALAFPTTGGRSYTATMAVVDEADFAEDLDGLISAVKPTIDAGGRLILLSTADKSQPESPFKRIYRAAVAKENGYWPVFLPWAARPDRNEAWYAEQRRDVLARTGALDDLFQEYPATVFEALAPRVLDRRFAAEWLAGVDRSGDAALAVGPAMIGLRVWRVPQPGEAFVIGADTAEGNPQSDDSAGSVCDLTGEQVATWSGRVEPSTFGSQIAAVSEYFNDAAVLVERNNHGHAVLLWLREFSVVRCLLGLDGKVGWATTGRSKPLAYDNAADVFRTGGAVVRDAGTLAQLASIQANIGAGDLAAPQGLLDDKATAHVLALAALRFCSAGLDVGTGIVQRADPLAEIDAGRF